MTDAGSAPGRRGVVGNAWRWLVALAVGVCLAGCGGGRGDDAAGGEPPATWVVLGSSTAAGTGASPGSGWTDLLGRDAASQGALLDRRALAGAVTYQALPAGAPRPAGRPATRLALDVDLALATRPSLLLIAFPTNDTMAGYAANETVANLTLLRARGLAAGATVIVLSTQPRDDANAAQRTVLAAVDGAMAAVAGGCFIDVATPLTGGGGGISRAYAAGDGVHLNDAGHRLVFERVRAVIDAGLCAPAPAR